MTIETIAILFVSTLGIVLIGYVILTPVLRALERPTLLLPWRRKSTASDLQEMGGQLLREPLSTDERHAVERALNTLSIPGSRNMSGPWAKSDPLIDAERDILAVKASVETRQHAVPDTR